MKRTLLACLFLLPGCSEPDPSDDGADDVETSDTTPETTGDGDTTSTTDEGESESEDDTTSTTDDDTTSTETTDGESDTTADSTTDGDPTTDDDTTDDDTTETTGGACPSVGDCNELLAAFQAETLAIRSCSADDQCGQVLQGTSCGCTRDWVALLDADTTCFYDLVDQANVLQCELPFFSTCDCPETDGYACLDGICAWNYL